MKFFAVVIFATFAAVISADDSKQGQVELRVVQNITEFKLANPELKVTPLRSVSSKQISPKLSQITYTLGSRVYGDQLVASDASWASYPNKQNIQLTIWYPVNGYGALISHVQVVVTQDTGTTGRGYIVSGGINQRNIQVVVEAWNTAYIDYIYRIYGK